MNSRLLPLSLLSGLLVLSACTEPTTPDTDNAAQIPVTSGDGSEPGGIHDLPIPQAVHNARVALATKLNIQARSILILEAHETEWSDSCLGLGGPAESCLAAMTPGYDVLMTHEGIEYHYRTNADGTSVREEE